MKTIPKEDLTTQVAERTSQKYYEKFKQECLDRIHKRQEAKEQKDKEAEKPIESADH